jgi:hypothetical protein
MKLLRCGAQKFHGWTTLSEKKASVEWDAKAQTLSVHTSYNLDPTSDVLSEKRYNYSVQLGLKDIEQILECLSSEALSKPSGPLIKSLSGSTLHLL